MGSELRDVISENTFFTKEAAEYLGISVQRLNQLVQSQKIVPLKKTSGAMLFLKNDLDSRREEIKNISVSSINLLEKHSEKHHSERQYEAIIYYTIQSFLNYSDKKASIVFESICDNIQYSKPLSTELKDISEIITIPLDSMYKRYEEVLYSFDDLQKDVRILKKTDTIYPTNLRLTQEAPPFIFIRGHHELLVNTIVAVVGTRHPTDEGARRAYKLSYLLGNAGIVVASGLANGIDTQALSASVKSNMPSIAVIGTPINRVYPKENRDLQEQIANTGLLISQFAPNEKVQRWFFPLRNGTMSAISTATVIVEAGETSGALKQADYAIKQGRLIFIPQSAIDNPSINWPKKYIKLNGSFSFNKIEDLLIALKGNNIINTDTNDMQKGLFEL